MTANTPLPSPVKLPKFIGLCGNPKAGKSEVQKILDRVYGYEPVDDGHVLREFAVEKLGLTWDDVQTQAGKLRYTEILGRNWQHREVLGELGKQLENMFGDWIMPFIATRGLPNAGLYSFGSVRKLQGEFYKRVGGMVIEVVNPMAGPSPYAFDQYDRGAIDATIDNDALARGMPAAEALLDLEAKVIAAVSTLKVAA